MKEGKGSRVKPVEQADGLLINSALKPILHSKCWNLSEVAFVSRNHRRRVSQRNSRDEQVGATDFFKLLVLAKSIKFCRSGLVKRYYRYLTEQFLAPYQPLKCAEQLLAIPAFRTKSNRPCRISIRVMTVVAIWAD
jgi:hypothetical protein